MCYAVLDSAYSSTVCGGKWLSSYIESLEESDRDKVKQSFSQTVSSLVEEGSSYPKVFIVFQHWLQERK